MKTLQKVQEENRKFIIMANNPTAKTYDEALDMELDIGCIISRYELGMWYQLSTEYFWRLDNFVRNGITNEHDFIFTNCGQFKLGQSFVDVDKEKRLYPLKCTKNNIPAVSKVELLAETKKKFPEWYRTQTIILGKPLTLSRVLIALAPSIRNTGGVKIDHYDLGLDKTLYLLENMGLGCATSFLDWDLTKETLEEQSEETQRKINALIK
jgi:hypothetical protein